ncbi:DNA cytosine methyltransferase [Bacillus cytotoxicus]|uniref:DNA cytosine methyltransferase n=1 Tax=Bacillus cytotoxicus TaxID=580165 RepID=UPI0006607A79|nr:DNA cytosine methyltransferase [Bacillus cytotoxicus]AWC31731.1 DNA cytosine methyltransferase [Bacillus cytotoxicus]AWC35769.1 DNA cytosine methyltransferase [Bacillus cytotoxicus]AWC60006.1 DNA cytosine methyltransferase [Bacillus cytotoxicus]KMT50233.1 restriction endonuclease DdeI [Bacillus cytotoxicus]QTR80751.1 DNA cytosine methyltransferase [Bacillus cytotoxicus]
MSQYKYTSIDLFSGPGGLTTGLKLTGIKPLIAVEINKETAETYSANHHVDLLNLEEYLQQENKYEHIFKPSNRSVLILGDVREVSDNLIKEILLKRFSKKRVDVITGGPPCESYSIAGKRLKNDERDYLYKHLSRIAKVVDASILLFENVKGILSKKTDNQQTFFSQVCEEFEKTQNDVSFRVTSSHKKDVLLNCANYGVPQNRERVFIVGINNKYENAYFSYPPKTHGSDYLMPVVTVGQAILDLPDVNVLEENEVYEKDNNYIENISDPSHKNFLKFVRGISPFLLKENTYDGKSLDSHKASKHFDKIIKRMSLIHQGEGMKTAGERLIKEGKQELRDTYFPQKLYGARYRRLKEDKPSFTVTSHCFDEIIHPIKNRALTPREAARLQTFPDWYIFKGPYVIFHSNPKQDRYEQIGDAVPPLVGYHLGLEIVNTLNEIDQNLNSSPLNFN